MRSHETYRRFRPVLVVLLVGLITACSQNLPRSLGDRPMHYVALSSTIDILETDQSIETVLLRLSVKTGGVAQQAGFHAAGFEAAGPAWGWLRIQQGSSPAWSIGLQFVSLSPTSIVVIARVAGRENVTSPDVGGFDGLKGNIATLLEAALGA